MINKSEGFTETEKLLADLCDKTFLKLWSYPNPFNESKKELCDLIAVFDKHVFIFFDRKKLSLQKENIDTYVAWQRWAKESILAQIKTANGAEKYIKNGGAIFLDKNSKVPFPIDIDPKEFTFHKIIVAHGAKEACKKFSNENIYGSLSVTYGDKKLTPSRRFSHPFYVELEKENPIHIFDSHNLEIIFSELDTFYDFTAYLKAKEYAINKHPKIVYFGEEDLLAYYFMNYDKASNSHFIAKDEDSPNITFIAEGEWQSFCQRQEYLDKKAADKESYLWDEIIQSTCDAISKNSAFKENLLNGKHPIHEMAKEPRFIRRALVKEITKLIQTFPGNGTKTMRCASLLPSFNKESIYVFLQIHVPHYPYSYDEYREKRRCLLNIACGAAKNKFNNYKQIIGIAIDAPKFVNQISRDLLLMDCSVWPLETKKDYEQLNTDWGFFSSKDMQIRHEIITEFPKIDRDKNR